MMKISIWLSLALLGLCILAVVLQFGASHYGWTLPFRGNTTVSAQVAPPDYVASNDNPNFGPECGGNGRNLIASGYGVNTDLKHQADQAVAIVEGTARVAGSARYADGAYNSDAGMSNQMDAIRGIATPFIIEVSKTYKGPEVPEWNVLQSGGLVECVSYRISADSVRLFNGAIGLFFITDENEDHGGNAVIMTIATNAPEWFIYSEENFGSIEDAVNLIGTTK